MKLVCMFSAFFLVMSIWILLPHHLDILSHFMYYNFLALFFFFNLVYITFVKQLFPYRHQSIISFLCCALPIPLLFLCSTLCLCCFLTLPVLDFSPPSLLSLMFLWVLSLHPSCQVEWGAPLGRCLQTAASLFGGLCQVGTSTKQSFTSLTTLWAGSIPPLRSGLYAQTLCQKLQKRRRHIIWEAYASVKWATYFFVCFRGLCRN